MHEMWQREGPRLFAQAAELTHHNTARYIVPIRLTLCDVPSQSFGAPMVNMRYALHSFTDDPVPLRYKVDTAFHESLHPFMDAVVPAKSALLAAHRSEPACVLSHLHLLALQKAVLVSLGEDQALESVVSIDSQLPSGCYKRAWALLNKSDNGYEAYVAEIARNH